MPWRRFSLSMLGFVWISSLCLNSCATPQLSRGTTVPKPQSQNVRPARTPDQPDQIRLLRIQELVIPQADLNQYPGLADTQVGAGLSQILVRILMETGRFDLMVPPSELAHHLGQAWGPSPEGLKMRATLNKTQTPSAFRLSAKLFNIATCQPLYRLASAQQPASCRSSVGVQVRIEAPSGQFVPGATHPLSPPKRDMFTRRI